MKTIITLIAVLIFQHIRINAIAQSAALDASFANNGIGVYNIPLENSLTEGRFSMQQVNGKIIMGVYMDGFSALVRLNPNGTLDNNFGGDGKILTLDHLNDGLVQPDGKILVTGEYEGNTVVLRYNNNGSLDKSFGIDGISIISFHLYSEGRAIAIQPDGKIVVAGYIDNYPQYFYAVARLNSDGFIDGSFGTKQISLTAHMNDIANAVFIQQSGNILIAGTSFNGTDNDLSVVRLKPDGAFDETFDGDGKLLIDLQSSAFDYAVSIAAYPNGKIIIAGNTGDDAIYDFALVRLNSNGSLDIAFDGDGKAIISIGTEDDLASEMAIQPDAKILLAGSTYITGQRHEFSVIRMNANGSLDNTFDTDGKQVISISANDDFCKCICLLANGKIFLGGSSGNPAMVSASKKYPHFGGPNGDPISSSKKYSTAQLNSNGSLDISFDVDGLAIYPTGNYDDIGNAIALDGNGKIVVAGRTLLNPGYRKGSAFRIGSSGTIDNSFTSSGSVYLGDGSSFEANSILAQPNGRILIAGGAVGADTSFSIHRLNSDGSPDLNFDGDGTAIIHVSGTSVANCITRQADGKILVAGYSTRINGYRDMAVIRLTITGTLDNTFDGDGIKIIPFLLSSRAYAIAVQSDGKIVIAGFVQNLDKNNPYDFAAARLNANGSSDNTFDADGKATIDISGKDNCYAMALQTDGKIVLAGSSMNGSAADFSVARLTATGGLDKNFDGDGKNMIALGTMDEIAKSVAIQTDGKIILGGYSFNGTDNDAAIVRLTSNGRLDNTFDVDGKAIFNMPATDEMINGVSLQTDGKILLAGKQKRVVEEFGNNILVMRLMGNGAPSPEKNSISSINTKINTISLAQNIPNPFNHTTAINYTLPQLYSSAKIVITDKSGKVLKEINISGSGRGSLNVDASMLSSGAYQYSLYVDGKLTNSKQMVLAK